MVRKIGTLILVFLVAFGNLNVFADAPTVATKSWFLYEMKTRQVLSEHHSQNKMPIASLTKLMTGLLTFEAVDSGQIQMDTVITVPPDFSNPGGSTMKLKPGMSLTVRQLLQGMLVVSGNDCAQLLAKTIGGSETQFVKKMNTRAKELGMTKTKYLNPTGLPMAAGENSSCAADLGTLVRELLANHSEELLPITRARSLESLGIAVSGANTNGVLSKLGLVDGLKTGHTDGAGYCLAATMPYPGADDYRVVAIVLGTKNENDRDEAAIQLLESAVENWEVKTFALPTDVINLGEWGGIEGKSITASPEKALREWVLRDSYKVEVLQDGGAHFPLRKGDTVGSIRVTLADGTIKTTRLLSNNDILDLSAVEQVQVLVDGFIKWWVPQSIILTQSGVLRYSWSIYR